MLLLIAATEQEEPEKIGLIRKFERWVIQNEMVDPLIHAKYTWFIHYTY